MKKNNLKKSIMVMIVFLMVTVPTITALACDSEPPTLDGCDLDMMLEENHEEFNPEHFEGMPQPAENHIEYNEEHDEKIRPEEYHETYNEELFEQIRPEEYREEMRPNEFSHKPYSAPVMPGYIWIIIAVGALVIVMVSILIIVIARKKQRRNRE